VYLVTLVVERKDGQSDNDTLTAFINLNQTVLDSVSTLQFSDNSTIAVKSERTASRSRCVSRRTPGDHGHLQ